MSERSFRELTEPEQALVRYVIEKHLDVPAATAELARFHINFQRLAGPEHYEVTDD